MIWRDVQQTQCIDVGLAGLPPLYSRGFTIAIAKRFCHGIITQVIANKS